MPPIFGDGRAEDVEISRAENERVEDLGDEGYTFIRQPMLQASNGDKANSPSALLLECIAHISISFDDVCETSPRM